jgi:hypothetical protein
MEGQLTYNIMREVLIDSMDNTNAIVSTVLEVFPKYLISSNESVKSINDHLKNELFIKYIMLNVNN